MLSSKRAVETTKGERLGDRFLLQKTKRREQFKVTNKGEGQRVWRDKQSPLSLEKVKCDIEEL